MYNKINYDFKNFKIDLMLYDYYDLFESDGVFIFKFLIFLLVVDLVVLIVLLFC